MSLGALWFRVWHPIERRRIVARAAAFQPHYMTLEVSSAVAAYVARSGLSEGEAIAVFMEAARAAIEEIAKTPMTLEKWSREP